MFSFHTQEGEDLFHRINMSIKKVSKFTKLRKKVRFKRIMAIRAAKGQRGAIADDNTGRPRAYVD